MIVRKIGFLAYPNMNSLDLSGPLETFATVQQLTHVATRYELVIIAGSDTPCTAESGLKVLADVGIDDVEHLDVLIIPGGKGRGDLRLQQRLRPHFKRLYQAGTKLVSVCTGSFLLASAGLLCNKRVTTHWAHKAEFKRAFPDVTLNTDALFIDEGDIATSAGITAGIDLSLKLIEDDCGSAVAGQVARYLVVHYRRAGHQAQYSEPLQFQARADSQLSSITAYIMEHLQQPLTVEMLADYANMSVRTFSRKFRHKMQLSPAKYIERVRLDYARQLLSDKDWALDKIARACGYSSVDVLRRAFERRFELSIKEYRARF